MRDRAAGIASRFSCRALTIASPAPPACPGRAPVIRERVARRLGWTGLKIDAVRNETGASRIDAGDSRTRAWQLKVDEEYELALAAAQYSRPEQ